MIYSLAYPCFTIFSDMTKTHEELNFLERVFLKNGTLCHLLTNVLRRLIKSWS